MILYKFVSLECILLLFCFNFFSNRKESSSFHSCSAQLLAVSWWLFFKKKKLIILPSNVVNRRHGIIYEFIPEISFLFFDSSFLLLTP